MRLVVLVSFLATSCATAKLPTAELADETRWAGTVLFTHPSVSVLKNLVALSEQGLLPTDRFRFVGVHHAREIEDYFAAQTFVKEGGRGWLAIRDIDCDLDAAHVFSENDCTETFERLVAQSDGLIFLGGPDLPPALYGEATRHTTVIEAPMRHYYELSWLYHLVGRGGADERQPLLSARPQYPVLTICLGTQSLNVAAGGTLVQDIPMELYGSASLEQTASLPSEQQHRNNARALEPGRGVGSGVLHPITVRDGSRLAALVAEADNEPLVLSIHHQAIEKLGAGLRVAASSIDGKVVEAVEHEAFAGVLGVQFHPEYRFLWQPDHEYSLSAGSAPNNHAFEAMQNSRSSKDFARALWSDFEVRLAAQAAGPGGAR